MSKEIGVDIVEFADIKERISDKFIKRILSNRELERYNKITNEQRKLEYIAGRFAAKEAYTKVYKKFLTPLNFVDVEILTDEFGAPYIESKYMPEDIVKVSISHSKNYVIAMCIKE
ncbi:MAG: Holo-[acyl-carrier-protein] synthase [Candidatus Izimaplasma bacterium HR2]|nr:MAG: Holo-[acyl-carrier-protein] synthase [Candidatus Izimaplasma bacterium HR2]